MIYTQKIYISKLDNLSAWIKTLGLDKLIRSKKIKRKKLADRVEFSVVCHDLVFRADSEIDPTQLDVITVSQCLTEMSNWVMSLQVQRESRICEMENQMDELAKKTQVVVNPPMGETFVVRELIPGNYAKCFIVCFSIFVIIVSIILLVSNFL